jgi:3-oxoadipate enol-lactonase
VAQAEEFYCSKNFSEEGLKMRIVTEAGSQIYYNVAGAGPVLVFVHSFLCDGELFKYQVAALQDKYRIINVDIRGHGQSGPDESAFTLGDLVQDVLAVLDAEKVERAIWIGMSIGGFISMRAAVLWPNRVSGLVLIGTEPGSQSPKKKLLDIALKASLRLLGSDRVVPTLMPSFLGKTTLKHNPALREEYSRIFRKMRVGSICAIINAVMKRDSLTERLKEINAPTLVMVGEEDLPMPVSIAEDMARRIPGAELSVISDAGHLCTVERPNAVNEVLLRFLARIA